MKQILDFLAEYDEFVLPGIKQFMTIAILFLCIFFLEQGKLQYFVSALGLVHLFALRVAKKQREE